MVWLPPTVNTSTIYNRWKFNRRGRLIKSINKPPSKTTPARLQNGGSCLSVFVCEETGAVFLFFYLLDLEEPRDTGSRCAV